MAPEAPIALGFRGHPFHDPFHGLVVIKVPQSAEVPVRGPGEFLDLRPSDCLSAAYRLACT